MSESTSATFGSCSFCGITPQQGEPIGGGLGAFICGSCVEQYHQLLSDPHKREQMSSPPWDWMSDDQLLESLPDVVRSAHQAEEFLTHWVRLLRRRKLSWAKIGDQLGISRQGAWERFAHKVD